MFGIILLSVCTLIHVYVFWRAASVPFVKRHISRQVIIGAGAVLWTIFFLGRIYGHGGTGAVSATIEMLGMTWMGMLFLAFVPLLATDLVTVFGFVMPRLAPSLRGWALIVGGGLSVIALVQGLRPPVVQSYEVLLPGLPRGMDGTVIVAMSDMHLGSLLGQQWLAARVDQVQALSPDLVVLLGDIFEGHDRPPDEMLSVLGRLSAPLGVWAVPGNHEFHGDHSLNTHLFEKAGFRVLRNGWAEVAPGLILAGVEDLTARRRKGQMDDVMTQTLSGHPPGGTIVLSHTPWQAERAAGAGAGLMLCGHTHGGQVWPFGYLIRIMYPLLEGRHEVGGMPVIVCRGTGTWGPRMRLWCPGEILRVTLVGKETSHASARDRSAFSASAAGR